MMPAVPIYISQRLIINWYVVRTDIELVAMVLVQEFESHVGRTFEFICKNKIKGVNC